jgi:hypothetical protein
MFENLLLSEHCVVHSIKIIAVAGSGESFKLKHGKVLSFQGQIQRRRQEDYIQQFVLALV